MAGIEYADYLVSCNDRREGYNNSVLSFGLIVYRFNEESKTLQYLMAHQRKTHAYSEFMRGGAHKNVPLKVYFANMTPDEKTFMRSHSPNSVWKDMFPSRVSHLPSSAGVDNTNDSAATTTLTSTSTSTSNLVFTSSSPSSTDGFNQDQYLQLYQNGELNKLLEVDSLVRDSPWILPKGRKNRYESPIQCALRECGEETGIKSSNLTVNPHVRIVESYTGCNNVKYKVVYYLASYTATPAADGPLCFEDGCPDGDEVDKVDWYNYMEGIEVLGCPRRSLLHSANSLLMKYRLHTIVGVPRMRSVSSTINSKLLLGNMNKQTNTTNNNDNLEYKRLIP